MRITTAPHAIEARAAFGGYSAFPRRVAPLLAMRLTVMREYAANRNHVAVWADTAKQVHEAIVAVCFAEVARRRRYRRFASRVALDAIVAYEKAYVVTLSRDEAGHYHPEPGTEYPFAVSDSAAPPPISSATSGSQTPVRGACAVTSRQTARAAATPSPFPTAVSSTSRPCPRHAAPTSPTCGPATVSGTSPPASPTPSANSARATDPPCAAVPRPGSRPGHGRRTPAPPPARRPTGQSPE